MIQNDQKLGGGLTPTLFLNKFISKKNMTIAISATMMLLGIWFQCMHPKSLPAGTQIARKPSRAPSASIAHSIPLGFGSW